VGIDSITLDDVKAFVKSAYSTRNLSFGLSGAFSDELKGQLTRALGPLSAAPKLAAPAGVAAHRPVGREVEIVQKETRATAISFGFPIPVTRSHADYPALALVRSWLGEHRATMARLFQRIRETRGMNYGDYAYIEAFPRGMFQFFPDPNIARRAQLFEVWIRPVRTNEDAHFALRVAIHELDQLAKNGLTQEQFANVRNYLMKNVYLLTATQDQALGYALDAHWYGTTEFSAMMRGALTKLTLADVNRVVKTYVQTRDLRIVMVTKDADDLKRRLTTDQLSSIHYDGEKPASLLAEDTLIGSMKLGIKPEAVRIVPIAEVFAAAP
jgi:zinc protease